LQKKGISIKKTAILAQNGGELYYSIPDQKTYQGESEQEAWLKKEMDPPDLRRKRRGRVFWGSSGKNLIKKGKG